MNSDLIDETVSGDTDIAVGGLAVSGRFVWRADCTVHYLENAINWYVPCAKYAKPWAALLSVYILYFFLFLQRNFVLYC